MNDNFELNFKEFLKVQKLWEAQQFSTDKGIIKDAIEYLSLIPQRSLIHPTTIYLFDLQKSHIIYAIGDFDSVFGKKFIPNMHLNDIVDNTYAQHTEFMGAHLHKFLKYMFSLSSSERDKVGYSVQFKYKRNNAYYWINQRSFKNFTDDNGAYKYVVLENFDITSTKTNEIAKFVVYHKDDGYIINESLYPTSYIIDELTHSEIVIARLTAEGKSDQEISEIKSVSVGTIKQHKKHIFAKLGIHKSTELVALAINSGIMDS